MNPTDKKNMSIYKEKKTKYQFLRHSNIKMPERGRRIKISDSEVGK